MAYFKLPLIVAWLGMFIAVVSVSAAEPTWRALWNGRDLAGWDMFMTTPDKTWEVPGLRRDDDGNYLEPIGANRDPLGVFTVRSIDGKPAIHVSGQGFGVISTKESFSNFHLRMQFKWGEKKWGSKLNSPRDCGLLYFCHGPQGFDHATWPRSVEFQIQERDTGDLFALGTQISVNARREGRLWLYDPKAKPILFEQKAPIGNRCVKSTDAEKPTGEWNTLDLFCVGADSIHVVNGVVVMRLEGACRVDGPAPVPLSGGRIALQTEGAEVLYRDIQIRAIPAMPPEFITN